MEMGMGDTGMGGGVETWVYRAVRRRLVEAGIGGLGSLCDTLAELADRDLVTASVELVRAVEDHAEGRGGLGLGLDRGVDAAISVAAAVRSGDGAALVEAVRRVVEGVGVAASAGTAE